MPWVIQRLCSARCCIIIRSLTPFISPTDSSGVAECLYYCVHGALHRGHLLCYLCFGRAAGLGQPREHKWGKVWHYWWRRAGRRDRAPERHHDGPQDELWHNRQFIRPKAWLEKEERCDHARGGGTLREWGLPGRVPVSLDFLSTEIRSQRNFPPVKMSETSLKKQEKQHQTHLKTALFQFGFFWGGGCQCSILTVKYNNPQSVENNHYGNRTIRRAGSGAHTSAKADSLLKSNWAVLNCTHS